MLRLADQFNTKPRTLLKTAAGGGSCCSCCSCTVVTVIGCTVLSTYHFATLVERGRKFSEVETTKVIQQNVSNSESLDSLFQQTSTHISPDVAESKRKYSSGSTRSFLLAVLGFFVLWISIFVGVVAANLMLDFTYIFDFIAIGFLAGIVTWGFIFRMAYSLAGCKPSDGVAMSVKGLALLIAASFIEIPIWFFIILP